MSATLQTTFTNECHSLGSEQSIEKRNAPKRIPRPPNAFMLYRSDFLKRRAVPPEVEKRQQNLSRIAGQCWNMLPETEKTIWHSKAAAVRAEHHARYTFCKTKPFHKDTHMLSEKDERRRSATKSGRSSGRCRTRQMQSPYCRGMFAALHDPTFSSPESHASLLSPTLAPASPLSKTVSLSPLLLPRLLPPLTSEDSTVWTDKHNYQLTSSDPETLQWGLSNIIRGLETTPSEIDASPEFYPTLRRCEDGFATRVPYPGFKELPKLRSDLVAQVPWTLSGSNTSVSSPERYHLADCRSLANDFGITDDFAHFNQSLSPSILDMMTNL